MLAHGVIVSTGVNVDAGNESVPTSHTSCTFIVCDPRHTVRLVDPRPTFRRLQANVAVRLRSSATASLSSFACHVRGLRVLTGYQ